jgi:L-amino acid N-acyltransferase YncA
MAKLAPVEVSLDDGRKAVIASLEESDAADLIAMQRAHCEKNGAFLHTVEEFDVTPQDVAEWARKSAADPDGLYLVARWEGRTVGWATLEPASPRRCAHRAFLEVGLHSDWRGCGLGTALMKALIAWATEHPTIEKLGAAVLETNEVSLRLAARLGFESEGRCKRAVKLGEGEYVDLIHVYRFVK